MNTLKTKCSQCDSTTEIKATKLRKAIKDNIPVICEECAPKVCKLCKQPNEMNFDLHGTHKSCIECALKARDIRVSNKKMLQRVFVTKFNKVMR